MMMFLELIPKKVYAVMVAALLALALSLTASTVHLKLKVAHGETKFSQLQTQVETDAKERERVAREDVLEVKRREAKHASMQQETVHAFHDKEAADRERDRVQRADIDLLRGAVRAYAAGGGGEGQGDASACRSDRDRSRSLGAALDEALGLQGEAESFIRQRDREVKLLKGTIANDRGLVQ